MPTLAGNVPFPFVLPPAALHAADRLIATLMTLVDAITAVATPRRTPATRGHAAQNLIFRLAGLVTALVRIATVGLRRNAAPDPNAPPRRPRSSRAHPIAAPRLPRRPGWLLDALPDLAPTIAADLAALLADPAAADLLGAAPTLHRNLRPLLRALGLAAPPPAPEPPPPRVPTPEPDPEPHHPAEPPRPAIACRSESPLLQIDPPTGTSQRA